MSGTPMRYPVSNFTSDFFGIGVTCNDRIVLIVVFKWLSFTGFEWTWENPILFFLRERRWGSNPQPHCSQSHMILSATPLWASRLNMLRNKCYHTSFRLLNSFFHHIGVCSLQYIRRHFRPGANPKNPRTARILRVCVTRDTHPWLSLYRQ